MTITTIYGLPRPTLACYAVIRHRTSGRLFRIARRQTDLAGRVPTYDWVKMPCDINGNPDWVGPQFLLASAHRTRPNVEDELLEQSDIYEVAAWRIL